MDIPSGLSPKQRAKSSRKNSKPSSKAAAPLLAPAIPWPRGTQFPAFLQSRKIFSFFGCFCCCVVFSADLSVSRCDALRPDICYLKKYNFHFLPCLHPILRILFPDLRFHEVKFHLLFCRFSSDDTDDDSVVVKKKKKPATNRRQTMANPMPPPSTPARKAPAKNYADFETGSDSDGIEEPVAKPKTRKSESPKKKAPTMAPDSTKSFTFKAPDSTDLGTSFPDVIASKPRTTYTVREESKFIQPTFKPSISPILPAKDESHKKDGVGDVLLNYETPYLSEFTRRLSTKNSNFGATSSPIIKSNL